MCIFTLFDKDNVFLQNMQIVIPSNGMKKSGDNLATLYRLSAFIKYLSNLIAHRTPAETFSLLDDIFAETLKVVALV